LQKLIDAGMPPALIVCNPDKPVGRKKILTAPPVKQLITDNQLPITVLQPEKLSVISHELLVSKLEFAVVAAYSKIIPKEILDALPDKFIGVHPSLLPKYRGPSPIQQTILDGKKETGVTLYAMDEKVDHGKIVSSSKYQVADGDTYITLEEKLARMGAELLISVMKPYVQGRLVPKEQNHAEATFTKKFTTENGLVDLEKDVPENIARKIRALNPEPGVYTFQNEKRLKLLEVKKVDDKLVITKTQLEGKTPKEGKIILG